MGFPFRKCQPQDVVIQPEAEAALKVREAQPKEPERAGAGSPLQAVLPPWQEPKQGLLQPLPLPMLHTGTTCLKESPPAVLCRRPLFGLLALLTLDLQAPLLP